MMTITENLPEEKWRSFVENHPNGNIFHTPEMFQVFARAKGHVPKLWAITENAGERVDALFLPVEISLAKGVLRPFTTRSIVYGGILNTAESQMNGTLNLLLQRYRERIGHRALFTELRNQTGDCGLQAIVQEAGFKFEAHNDYIVDLTRPVTEVWNNIHKTARAHIRKAHNRNRITIREIEDPHKLPRWYRIVQKSFSRAHVPLADISLFESAFDVLFPRRMIQFLIGETEDGRDIAASVALLYNGTIYGWYRGFDRRYSHYLPNDQMVWHLLEWGARNGFQSFDFGGAGRPNQAYGPRNFKAKFGGKLVNYGRNTLVHNGYLLKLSSVMYKLYQRVI